jgi:PEGA domain
MMPLPFVAAAALFSTAAWAGDAYVASSVPGGRIIVDGVDSGLLTPSTLTGLTDGEHVVTVLGDCTKGKANVRIAPDVVARVNVNMVVGAGTLAVQPVPSEVKVEMDGRPFPAPIGTPVAVSCGEHQVAVSLDGYMATVVTVDVYMDEDVVLPVHLVKLGFGSINLTVDPKKAEVLLDGVSVELDSAQLKKVQSGPHVVRAQLDGYLPREEQVTVEEGKALAINLVLSRGDVGSTKAPTPAEKAEREPKPGRGARVAGWTLTVLGAGAGLYTGYEYSETQTAYAEYQDRVDDVKAGLQTARWADDYYDGQVAPHRTKMIAAGAASGVLLATGIGLVIAF